MPASAFSRFILLFHSAVVFRLVKAFKTVPTQSLRGILTQGIHAQGAAKATELRTGLRMLQLRVGLSHNTRAGVQHRLIRADLGATQHQRPLAVTLGIHVADQTAKVAALKRLQLTNQLLPCVIRKLVYQKFLKNYYEI